MKTGNKRTISSTVLLALLPFILSFFTACSTPPPSEAEMRAAITKNFEERRYKVQSLELGKFTPQAMREKVYMGAPAYTVEIRTIVLDPSGKSGKTGPLEFHDGLIQLVLKTDKGVWVVSRISGIPVP